MEAISAHVVLDINLTLMHETALVSYIKSLDFIIKAPNYLCLDLQYVLFLDINECFSNNGNCSQTCNNTIGNYLCSCKSGYVLDGDNVTCKGKL